MKKIITVFLLLLYIILVIPFSSYAHSGRTDSKGGHKDNKNKSGLGYYHYHCGGNPAHLHKNGICPYKNSTDYNYGNTSLTHRTSPSNSTTTVVKYWSYNRYWNGYNFVTGWQNIDDKLYYFDSNGYLYKDQWLKTDNGEKYYIDHNGVMCIGWTKINDNYYYFNKDGIMLTGWNKINNNTYYLGENGQMRTGLLKVDNFIYYFNNNGSMCTGWITINKNTYYFKPNGKASVGKVKINGMVYNFDKNGKLITSNSNFNESSKTLAWGMYPEEVIEIKALSDYEILNNLLYTTNHTINNCYMFDDNNELCGYGKITAYSSDSWFKFKVKLIEQGWEVIYDDSNLSSDPQNPIYVSGFMKDSHITLLVNDNLKIIQMRFSDSYIKNLL